MILAISSLFCSCCCLSIANTAAMSIPSAMFDVRGLSEKFKLETPRGYEYIVGFFKITSIESFKNYEYFLKLSILVIF